VYFTSGRATAPGATITSVTMTTGDDNHVINFSAPHRAFICNLWNKSQAVGKAQFFWPKAHDQTNNYRWTTITGDPFDYWPTSRLGECFAQDAFTAQISGSAVAGQFEFMGWNTFVTRIDGIAQNLLTWDEVVDYAKYDITTEHSIVAGVTGAYSEVAFNSGAVFNLRANTYYAVCGFFVNAAVFALTLRGPDLGGLRIGVPGNSTNKEIAKNFFKDMAILSGIPFIPIINSANGGPTNIGVLADQAGGTFVVNTQLVMLDDRVGQLLQQIGL
jgi:hypothetical protein